MFDGNKIICITTCYNELNKIDKVAAKMDKNVVDEFLIIDDGSTDQTATVARASGAKVLNLGSKRGLAEAFRAGLKEALKENADIVVTIDADAHTTQCTPNC